MRDKLHYVLIAISMVLVASITDSATVRWLAVVVGLAAVIALVVAAVRGGSTSGPE